MQINLYMGISSETVKCSSKKNMMRFGHKITDHIRNTQRRDFLLKMVMVDNVNKCEDRHLREFNELY